MDRLICRPHIHTRPGAESGSELRGARAEIVISAIGRAAGPISSAHTRPDVLPSANSPHQSVARSPYAYTVATHVSTLRDAAVVYHGLVKQDSLRSCAFYLAGSYVVEISAGRRETLWRV